MTLDALLLQTGLRIFRFKLVQQLAGHSDIATTRKCYLAVRSEDMAFAKEVVKKTLVGARRN